MTWVTWRQAGYEGIAYADVAWPGRWERVKTAQARYFREQGRVAVMRGDFPAALLSLSTAEQFVRGGWKDRVLLARMWAQAGNPGYADRMFREVTADYPEKAEETAVLWHDQLLASGQLEALAELCVARLAAAPPGAGESLWEFSLLYALEHGSTDERMMRKAEEARLPERVRRLGEVLVLWQRGGQAEATRLLGGMRFAGRETLAARVQIEWLARWGAGEEAGVVLNRHATQLGEFEVAALRYHIDMAAGRRDAGRANFRALLGAPLTAGQADRLCALAITMHDATSLRTAPGFFELPPLDGDAEAQAAFWVAALACDAPMLAEPARRRYASAAGGRRLPDVPGLDRGNRNPADRTSPLFVIGSVPLPRQTVYALIAAMADEERKKAREKSAVRSRIKNP